MSIYTDCHSVFWTDREPTVEEQLLNKKPTTEVGRGLEELGVTLILAHSPQAKGRIERLWNTFQDRLVSELRLANAKTLEQAQAVLERYIPEHNRRFAKPAKARARLEKGQLVSRSNEPCASSSNEPWPRTTRLLSKGQFCRFPRPRPFVLTLTGESRCT